LAAFAVLGSAIVFSQPVNSPEEAGIEPITGDMAPWRPYGADEGNFDSVWITALNNGNIAVFKRGSDFETPGVVGGTEFLLFGPDGQQLNEIPTPGNYQSDGNSFPWVDYAGTGLSWGYFTLGAAADKANGTGFIVHNQGEAFADFGLEYGDVVGNEAFSLVQLFDNDGNPVGSSFNAFGALTAEGGEYRDVGASILSNGDIVVLGEDRQVSDDLLDEVAADASSVAIAIILAPDGSVRFGPFVPHTDEDGLYLGGSSSAVFQNMTAFGGGFVIDYGDNMRWYNNDGTPITPAQPDHADVAGQEADPDNPGFLIPESTGGRGDSVAMASNGKDMVVKSANISSGPDSIGVLFYYNLDGSVDHFVRFDDVVIEDEIAMVDRTFCDMDQNGNVFVIWEDKRFGGDSNDSNTQVFGRFFDKDGVPYGPSFPIYENWVNDPQFIDYGGVIGNVGLGDQQQPRCALNNQVAAVVSASTIMPGLSDLIKQLSSAFGLVLDEPVVRIFKNPFAEQDVQSWSIY
ncbi:hypothetical protein K8I31_15910, partial [bacterium]|nr:hypothetical protein [bacterium]